MKMWDCPKCLDIIKSDEYRLRKMTCNFVIDHVILLEEMGRMHDDGHKENLK